MTDYAFYCAQLRYFARTTDRISPEVGTMMDLLDDIADQVEKTGAYTINPPHHRLAARALAGVAGLLQTHVLPEVVAAQNAKGESQVRWTIDRSMEAMTALMAHADGGAEDQPKPIPLPAPPPECTPLQ